MGGMSKEVCGDGYDGDDKCQDGEQKSSYVERGAVLGLGRRLGDAEEIDKERGDVAEERHVYSMGGRR